MNSVSSSEVALPYSWVEVEIGDVAQVKGGKRLPKGKSLLDTPTAYPYIRVTDFDAGTVNFSNLKYLDENTQKEIKNYTISKDDLYISIAGTIGLIGEIPEQLDGANLTENAAKLCDFNGVQKSYLRHVLSSHTSHEQFQENTTSSGQPKLALFRIKSCCFPLSPLAEQKVIADKLDTLLAEVETTKARLERIPEILKSFRQSVLAAAVSGKLTEEWRLTYNGDRSWTDITLQEVAHILDPHPSHRTPKAVEGGVPYIGIGDLKEDGTIDFENARKVSLEVLKEHNERYTLKNGDFVFGKIGTLGKATVLPLGVNYTLSANVILIQPKETAIAKYIQYFLSSPSTMDEIAKQANSTSQAAFGIKKMRAFRCSLPTKEEQTEIVYRLEELFAFADSIEQKATAALARVNNLTQSILAKAFRGELTADWRAANPELISGDNSAAALLEKIKAERAALAGKKTRKKV
ncbi:restriction endonuclease subunit S [Shewanella xiamenensis]|uniref:restriction endonuclease subunit S n=1 Tax=Shewanella xiamenensis TaxID=332186 RepID=UPI002E7B08DE|nr:restriction endonuclease subunit S [Shewanella xiamenensis]